MDTPACCTYSTSNAKTKERIETAGILKEGPIRKALRNRKHSPEGYPPSRTLVDELIRRVDEAKRDEDDAKNMYNRIRTDLVAIFPPGTAVYDMFIRIVSDEVRHSEDLSRIRSALEAMR